MRTLSIVAALAATALLGACATHDNMARSGYYADTAAAAPAPPPSPAYEAPPPAPAYVPPAPPPAPEPAARVGERG